MIVGSGVFCRPRVQQTSLQSRHFPVEQQGARAREFVGDWLIGPVAYADADYSLAKAQSGYKALMKDLSDFGRRPLTVLRCDRVRFGGTGQWADRSKVRGSKPPVSAHLRGLRRVSRNLTTIV